MAQEGEMSAIIYLYRSCSSCREAEAMLRRQGVELTIREFFKDRFTEPELRALLRSASMQPSELVSRRSKVFREQELGTMDLDEDEWVKMMIEEPTLIRRPVLVVGDKVVVGFNRKTYESLFMATGTSHD